MSTLRVSLMRSTETEMALVRQGLAEFEATHRIRVELIPLEWPTAWRRLVDFATSGPEPDVSLVGTSWIMPFHGMQVIRPFSISEIAGLGGSAAYVSSVWEAGVADAAVWALPWQVDTRLVFFWRSALERAGIDESSAFSTYAQFERTVDVLLQAGQSAIVAPTTASAQNTLHHIAAWVWSNGGDFLSPRGDRVIFDQPAALEGIQNFYRLHRSLTTARLQGLTEREADRAFQDKKAAITISGSWIIDGVAANGRMALDDLGIAPMPGIPYNGGSSFVIWRRTLQEWASLDLVRFLMQRVFQLRLSRNCGHLSARLDVLTDPELTADRFFAALSANVLRGRTLPKASLWGMIEDRLGQTVGAIWKDALDPFDADPRERVASPIRRLAQQLNNTLGH